jgi:hypothetical protein
MYSMLIFKSPIALGNTPAAPRQSWLAFPAAGEIEMTDFGLTIHQPNGPSIDVFKENIASATRRVDPAVKVSHAYTSEPQDDAKAKAAEASRRYREKKKAGAEQ